MTHKLLKRSNHTSRVIYRNDHPTSRIYRLITAEFILSKMLGKVPVLECWGVRGQLSRSLGGLLCSYNSTGSSDSGH